MGHRAIFQYGLEASKIITFPDYLNQEQVIRLLTWNDFSDFVASLYHILLSPDAEWV